MAKLTLDALVLKEVREWSTLVISLSALTLASIPFVDRVLPLPAARVRVPYDAISYFEKDTSPKLVMGVNFYNLGNRPFTIDGILVYLHPETFENALKTTHDCDPPDAKSIVVNSPDATSGPNSGWPVGVVPSQQLLGYRLNIPLFPERSDSTNLEGLLCVLALADSADGHGAAVAIPIAAVRLPKAFSQRASLKIQKIPDYAVMRVIRFVYGGNAYQPNIWSTP